MATHGQTLHPDHSGVNTNTHRSPLTRFLNGEPKALGTVQIMIGLVTVLFGIVFVSDPAFAPISAISGNLFWGPVVVQGSLALNVISALFSAAGIGVLISDFFLLYYCYPYGDCYSIELRSKAISGVLLVFTVLQFIISICVAAYGCNATCCNEPAVPLIMYTNQAVVENPQGNIVTYPKQTVPGNPQHMVYIPNMNTHTHVQPNMYDRPGR